MAKALTAHAHIEEVTGRDPHSLPSRKPQDLVSLINKACSIRQCLRSFTLWIPRTVPFTESRAFGGAALLPGDRR